MSWTPITKEGLEELVLDQLTELSDNERLEFNRYRIPLTTVKICRSLETGDEDVFVIAKSDDGVLYFDDVEWCFSFSPVDEKNRVKIPRCNECSLADAVRSELIGFDCA
jgi:hypothetical protein